MAAAVHIPLSECLQAAYRPECEYVEGEVRARNGGKYEHAGIQALRAVWFGRHEARWSAMEVTEQRVRVSEQRVRIPDVAIIAPRAHPDVLTDPPIPAVGILSPDGSYADMEERVADYLAMGIQPVWIIDPKTRTGRMCIGEAWIAGARPDVPVTAIDVELPDVFRSLDQAGGLS
jgi:Uma2 family endonuclease